MNNKLELLEVEAKPIECPLEHPNKDAPKSEKEHLLEIIQQKNKIIEQQTDYIAELQEDVFRLRRKLQLLTL